jgi:chemotaxis protein methyltransferase CheR
MDDADCIAFLQWALPQLNLRWPGFRKVRRQVCRRLKRRIRELQLGDLTAYQARLEADHLEWRVLDECCHITISRFYRDRGVFDALRSRVLPDIASRAKRERRAAHVWSAGCASGEEPYTLKILWDLEIANSCPSLSLSILATDVDKGMLERAQKGCFEPTSLHELPQRTIDEAFDQVGALFCVKQQHRGGIEFLHQDLRSQAPTFQFDLILCRYVAFTYFANPLQELTLHRLLGRLLSNGYLVIGTHEKLPDNGAALTPMVGAPQIFQKKAAPPN